MSVEFPRPIEGATPQRLLEQLKEIAEPVLDGRRRSVRLYTLDEKSWKTPPAYRLALFQARHALKQELKCREVRSRTLRIETDGGWSDVVEKEFMLADWPSYLLTTVDWFREHQNERTHARTRARHYSYAELLFEEEEEAPETLESLGFT